MWGGGGSSEMLMQGRWLCWDLKSWLLAFTGKSCICVVSFSFCSIHVFFFSLHFVPFAVEANFSPSNLPFGSKLCTGIKLNTNCQKGSALITRDFHLLEGLKLSYIWAFLFLLLLCNSPGRCLPTPNNLPRLFFLSKITSELSSSEKLL